jgi:aminoglycoside phosphotransferase (APT) family kinase protein
MRFLHMDDKNRTVLVVRVPYRPEEGWTAENMKTIATRLSSEVATMQYVRAHTRIPVPRVIHHSVEVDSDGVGSPYMIMTKVDGVALSSIWDDMEDSKREIVLRQVVDILLELASQRFDKIGMLFQQENHTDSKNAWCIIPYDTPWSRRYNPI